MAGEYEGVTSGGAANVATDSENKSRNSQSPRWNADQAAPTTSNAWVLDLGLFGFMNLLAALYAPIPDCDETFNYWEPTHYLDRGFGLQTWEYSPEYALRSWLYIALHAVPGKVASIFLGRGRSQFYAIRVLLGMACATAQTHFSSAI